jgi:Transposase DDE domain
LVSLDGSTLDVADTADNDKAFGRPGASRGSSAFPKIRFVALLENGTHVLWAAHMDQYATDELTLAEKVIPALRKGMLCMADRFFPSYNLWRAAAKTGEDLLWRTRQNARLEVEKRLPDGSYLSRIYAATKDRRKKRNGIVVRVIEYRLKDVPDAEPLYRLLTTILDPELAPAKELAALYHERWEIETTLDELKTHLRGAQIVLRSKTPELVRQEFFGLLMAHFAIRGLTRSRLEGRRRPRPAFVRPFGARSPTAHGSLRRYSPLGREKRYTKRSSIKFLKSGSSPAATGSMRAA